MSNHERYWPKDSETRARLEKHLEGKPVKKIRISEEEMIQVQELLSKADAGVWFPRSRPKRKLDKTEDLK